MVVGRNPASAVGATVVYGLPIKPEAPDSKRADCPNLRIVLMSNNTGMSIALSEAHVGAYKEENSNQRWAKSALRAVWLHLDGITAERADALRREYCDLAPRAHTTAESKAKGGVAKSTETMDFVKAGVVPPVLVTLREAAERVSQLKMLGAFPAEARLTIDMAAVVQRHDERWSKLAR